MALGICSFLIHLCSDFVKQEASRQVVSHQAELVISRKLNGLYGVPRYLETDYFAVCPITSGSTGVPSACTASSAAGSSPNA